MAGKIRPANEKVNRVDRRLIENQSPNKACVLSIRQRGEEGEGAVKTKTFVIKSENAEAIDPIIRRVVETHATMNADQYKAYNFLAKHFTKVRRVDHSAMYVDTTTGASVNQCESYNARIRRGHIGQHHKFSIKYLPEYAAEYSFREDTRRWANGDIFGEIVSRCAVYQGGMESNWVGYWQGRKKADLVLI